MTQPCKVLFSLIALLAAPTLCNAQNLETKFDDLLSAQFPINQPGAVALVAIGGEIVYHKPSGKANLELSVDMNADMKFMLGSITKQFTAVSILMLMEQGKLNLSDEITKYIPDYPTHGHHITIHHLLTHTSGIANSTTLNPWDADVRKRDFEPSELIDYFKNEPMRSSPGEVYRYNNFGYHILGYIIEIISGQTYEEFIESNIFQPLGMKDSYYGSHADIIMNRAYGYTKSNGFKNAEYISLSQPYAAGSLMSTVKDQFTWNRATIANKLIKKESLQKAWANYELNNGKKINYGYGWFVNEVNGSRTFEHAGGISGFQTNIIYMPDEDVFVAVFSNCDATDPRPISTRMAGLAVGKPYPELESVVNLTDKQLQKWVGNYNYEDGSIRIVELDTGTGRGVKNLNFFRYHPNLLFLKTHLPMLNSSPAIVPLTHLSRLELLIEKQQELLLKTNKSISNAAPIMGIFAEIEINFATKKAEAGSTISYNNITHIKKLILCSTSFSHS